jgi:hypothetical protein
MSLINDLSAPLEERQQDFRNRVQMSITTLFQQMKNVFSENFNLVWFNPRLTPQEAVDALGSDAIELFRLAEILTGAVNAAKPGTITPGIPAGYTVTPNEYDGTVTITKQ